MSVDAGSWVLEPSVDMEREVEIERARVEAEKRHGITFEEWFASRCLEKAVLAQTESIKGGGRGQRRFAREGGVVASGPLLGPDPTLESVDIVYRARDGEPRPDLNS